MSAPDDIESAIQKLYKQIEVEKNIIRGTKAAAQASQDSAFKLQCQSKLTDNQKNVNYLESKMRELKLRTRPEGEYPTQTGKVTLSVEPPLTQPWPPAHTPHKNEQTSPSSISSSTTRPSSAPGSSICCSNWSSR